jgi:putative transposase
MCTANRRQAFADETSVSRVAFHLRRTAAEDEFAVIAYCFMPDHLHLLVEGASDTADMRRFAKIFRQRAAHAHSAGGCHRLWQDGYYDRVLRNDEPTAAIVAYLIENPLRAELVADVRAYPFWGSSVYTREELIEFAGNSRPT